MRFIKIVEARNNQIGLYKTKEMNVPVGGLK